MPIDRLRADLSRLREEIAAADAGDREALVGLEGLASDIERELAEDAVLRDPAGLIDELERAVSGFEAKHPNLTAIVNNILGVLGGMGV